MLKLIRNNIRTIKRWFDPHYALQRQATRRIRRDLAASRRAELDAIPGTTSQRKCELLCHLAAESPGGGVYVEIGAFKGKSAAWIMDGIELGKKNAKPTLASIDPHGRGTWDEYQNTIQQFRLIERGLEVYRDFSAAVGNTWTRPISFLWIDGSHKYEDVKDDIRLFVPHLISGAWVIFDDAAQGKFPGVEQAIAEDMMTNPGLTYEGTIKDFVLFRKK